MTTKYLKSSRRQMKKKESNGKAHNCLGELPNGSQCKRKVRGIHHFCRTCKARVRFLDEEHYELHATTFALF